MPFPYSWKLTFLAFSLLVLNLPNAFALSPDVMQRGQKVVDELNLYRRLSGLSPVTFDVSISDACVLHAQYLDQNSDLIKARSLDVHQEDPARPGYTPEGAAAGASSDISFFSGGNPDDAGLRGLEFFYNSYYHRSPLIASALTTVGYGDSIGGKSGLQITLLRFGQYNGTFASGTLLTPPPGSTGIRNSGGGFEIPSPTPTFGTGSGNPIVAYFYSGGSVAWVSSTITARSLKSKPTAKPKILPHTVIAPNMPVNPVYEGNSICLITSKALPKNSIITVQITYLQSGVSKTVTWSFSTSAKGPFDPVVAAANEPPQFDSEPTALPAFGKTGQPIQFTCAASDTTPVTFAWDFGDGSTASDASVSHTYSAAGTYNVTVTVTNSTGKSVNQSISVTIQ